MKKNTAYVGAETTPCNLRETEEGGVCVCTATYCDYLEDPTPEHEPQFSLVSSSKVRFFIIYKEIVNILVFFIYFLGWFTFWNYQRSFQFI